ncbi:MAG TPA: alpha/beta fold hydrolase, partial [Kofleriaceae bacterium]|nr:alpha/beta fold hydrolase [Kofleriaceae bacterium]
TARAEHRRVAPPPPPPRWQTLPDAPALPAADATLDVPVDGATIHAVSFGHGPAVVLLHGGCGQGGQFGFLVPALAAHHQVIVVDARGEGQSGLPAAGLSYHLMAEDVVAVLDALHVPRAAALGWSDGAIVALDLAMHHGDRLTGALAFAANLDPSGTRRPPARGLFDRYYARCNRDAAALQPDKHRRDAARSALRAMWKREPRYTDDDVRAIAVPVTVVRADHDELIRPEHAAHIAAVIPGARLVTLHDVGHFAMFQDPDQFARVALEFLDGAAPAPAPATQPAPPPHR